jgi:hypothetical protein
LFYNKKFGYVVKNYNYYDLPPNLYANKL